MAKKPAPRRKGVAVDPVRFVADRLRQLREERGLSQEALADRAGVSAKFIGEIERGSTNTSVAVLWQLSVEGLRVPMTEFFVAADHRVEDDVATVSAIVAAQPPVRRRQAIRVLRALYVEGDAP